MSDTRERLLDAAQQLFLEKGYHSTSIVDILQKASANSGSLYHFFPTKQDLLLTVLERYLSGFEVMLLQPAWKGVTDPIDRVLALLEHYRRLLAETDFHSGCPIGLLAMELHEPDPAVREMLAANFSAWAGAVRVCLDDAGDRLPPDTDGQQLADFVLSVMEGGVMLARTHRSLDPLDAGIQLLRDYFEILTARPAAPGAQSGVRGTRRGAGGGSGPQEKRW